MNKAFYSKLALDNIKKNAQTYTPYLLTSIAVVMMYYLIHALAKNTSLAKMSGGTTISSMLSFGYVIVGLFSIIFLLYANSFLIKRRTQEFGLFNILGMEKKHIAVIMVCETIFIGVISISLGLLAGILLSKLMFLFLLKLLRFEVQMGFEISWRSILSAMALFAGIFSLTLLSNLRQIHLAKPIELLQGEQVGEREPQTKWLLSIIGFAALAAGYYLALTITSPIAAISVFFVAVLLVMIGTYSLFTSGSITILKVMRSNKAYFYRPKQFTTISGLLYRMKKNAVGLANICILSTMVLVTLSTTLSLYLGTEEALQLRYPRDIIISSYDIINGYDRDLKKRVSLGLDKRGLKAKNIIEYRALNFLAQERGQEFLTDRSAIGEYSDKIRILHILSSEDYSAIKGETVTLDENEILIYSDNAEYGHDILNVLGRTFSVKERLSEFAGAGMDTTHIMDGYYLIVRDSKVLEEIYESQLEFHGEYGSQPIHYLAFDFIGGVDQALLAYQEIKANLPKGAARQVVDSLQTSKDDFYSLYGSLFFLGLFLGILFITGTVLIIYYKQITEGYEDKKRFEIMQKVGMSKEEVKGTIRNQVLTVFFLPLITSAIHIVVAFRFITKLLLIFNLKNTTLFAWCAFGTVLIFALFYALVYSWTAKVYYNIVSR